MANTARTGQVGINDLAKTTEVLQWVGQPVDIVGWSVSWKSDSQFTLPNLFFNGKYILQCKCIKVENHLAALLQTKAVLDIILYNLGYGQITIPIFLLQSVIVNDIARVLGVGMETAHAYVTKSFSQKPTESCLRPIKRKDVSSKKTVEYTILDGLKSLSMMATPPKPRFNRCCGSTMSTSVPDAMHREHHTYDSQFIDLANPVINDQRNYPRWDLVTKENNVLWPKVTGGALTTMLLRPASNSSNNVSRAGSDYTLPTTCSSFDYPNPESIEPGIW